MKELSKELFPDLAQFLKLDKKIKELTKERDALAKGYKETVKGLEGYDPLEKYQANHSLEFSTNAADSVDVEAAVKAMENAKLRRLLFPAAVTFKLVATKEAKALAEAHKLVAAGRSDVVMKVVAK